MASKTDVTARFAAKRKAEPQPAKVLDLSGMRSSSVSVMTAHPVRPVASTDEQKTAENDYDAALKELQRSNPKTGGAESRLADAHRRLVRLGLRNA